jgi:hypothetical protein
MPLQAVNERFNRQQIVYREVHFSPLRDADQGSWGLQFMALLGKRISFDGGSGFGGKGIIGPGMPRALADFQMQGEDA